MEKQKLRKYLSEQDMSWQILFGLFFLDHLGLTKEEFEFDIRDAVKFADCEQDYEAIYEIIDYLNFHEDEIAETLQNLRFKPIPWQYDFIEIVSKASGFNITQTLDRDALTAAYGYALIVPEIDFKRLCSDLDRKYVALFNSAGAKMQKLKRNFVLALECMLWAEENADKLNFRELLNLYIPRAGIDEVIKAYKHAVSPDVKLTKDEKACLAFAYYSPFFYDEVNIANGKMPEGSVFFCAETRLQEDKDFFARHRNFYENEENDDDDDDDNYGDEDYFSEQDEYNESDESENFVDDNINFQDSAPFNHLAVYVDPLKRCVIDSMICDNAYANVYIEKLSFERMNNSLTDFIRYNKGCLYTVEFVNNIKELDVAQKLNYHIDGYEKEIKRLNEELERDNLNQADQSELESKLQVIEEQLSDCYFIS
ncbi:MAG: hypothetical protein IJ677_04905 [Alphaproteobacteria bacterium]|nr:hypothetical protein [Alphaproteobacteria bacterium]